jgi:redox-sensitive bicupin YhaK (pirin superfamily)
MQIWIMPNERGLQPGYEQKDFRTQLEKERLVLAASPDGQKGSVTIHQDANLYLGRADTQGALEIPLGKNRAGWIQVTRGNLSVSGQDLNAGDGAAIADVDTVKITSSGKGEFLFFDLA